LYLAAGRPIVFHGPERSTPTRFLERWPVGVPCHSLDPRAIGDALTMAAAMRVSRSGGGAIPQVLRAELGLHVFRRRFAEFVGVDESVLAAPAPNDESSCRAASVRTVLLISYTFPPQYDVSARRAAKLCKYLRAPDGVRSF
jgi:hypothetical protein